MESDNAKIALKNQLLCIGFLIGWVLGVEPHLDQHGTS
jgi:hypothetical protein